MFKLKFKTTLIAAVIASLLLTCFVVQSNAASVTSMSIYSGDDWGSGTTVSVSLTTDEDIDFIDWHIDGEYSFTSTHGDTQSVYVYLGTYVGNIKGIKYDVRGVVSFEESSDADASDTFKVYKPVVDASWFQGVYGAAYLYSITYDGSSLSMSGSIHGYNSTNITRNVSGKYRLTVSKNGEEIARPEDPAPGDELDQGESYNDSGGPSHFIGAIGDDETYGADGYVRIFVGVPTWNAVGSASFDVSDNPGN